MRTRRTRRRNPSVALSDCPVLEREVWDEEDVAVALDWAMEHGLIEDPTGWFLPPAKRHRPVFWRLAFQLNIDNSDMAWMTWNEYGWGEAQAYSDAEGSSGGVAYVRRTYMKIVLGNFRKAYILGYKAALDAMEDEP